MAQYPASISLASLGGTTGYTFQSGTTLDWFGYAIASPGDVNGDGINDILIGEPGRNLAFNRPTTPVLQGRTFLIYGNAANLAALDAADGTTDGIINVSLMSAANGYGFANGAVGDASGTAARSIPAIRRDGGAQNMIGEMQTRAELYKTISYNDYEALDASIVATIVPRGMPQR